MRRKNQKPYPSLSETSDAPKRRNRECTPLTAAELQHAAWIRLPQPRNRCPLTGLSRTGLIELCERSNGAIKVARIQRPGTARGVILIHRESLLAYLDSLATRQAVL